MHVHILGICGTFMGGIAAIASAAGYRVTGCDANVYPPMSEQLAALGIGLIEGFGEDQLKLKPDLWVVGNVVTRGNPLMEAILDRGERYVSGPHWIAEHVLAGRHVLAVAGTHGKTTASAMLAWILESAGRSPGFLIGGVPMDFPVSARHTGSNLFVIEADEYDTAFFDKRSKFVHYGPRTAILNNLEFDHADIFDDLEAIERQFNHFVRIVPRSGLLVVNGQDVALERVLTKGAWTPIEHFGVPTGWEAGAPDADGSFEVAWRGAPQGHIRWQQLGQHNRMNALAALAAARHVGVAVKEGVDALSRVLDRDALRVERWNRLHPAEPEQQPYIVQAMRETEGPIIASTDYMKIVPDQIAPWLNGRLVSLGTDGFGRSDSREYLRNHFEINAESIVAATLSRLAREGKFNATKAAQSMIDLGLRPEVLDPSLA